MADWNNWNPSLTLPPNPTIRLIFNGLLSICHNKKEAKEVGEIGIHNDAPGHKLTISVWDELFENSRGGTKLVGRRFETDNPHALRNKIFKLEVPSPADMGRGISFYQPKPVFSRDRHADDNKDFRWIVDLENHEFYDKKLTKQAAKTVPRFTISDCIFYTHCLTNSEFKRYTPRNNRHLGPIAYMVAAQVYVAPGTKPSLTIADKPVDLLADHQYQIEINNLCEKEKCNYHPQASAKEDRSDFYLYYKTFDIPPTREEYEIRCDPPSACSNKSRGADELGIFDDIGQRATDAAPCSAIGHGKSDGLG